MRFTRWTAGSLLAAIMFTSGVTGCGSNGGGEGAPVNGAAAATLPDSLFLPAAPESAPGVADAKTGAAAGQPITLRGRIGGSRTPFVDGRAAFTIVGAGPAACSDTPGDECRTPWDYCCEPRESLAKHSATIRIVDAAGQPLKVNAKGARGLRELSEIIVVGTVAQSEGDLLVVDATGIFIVQ
ncbi:MAG: hypothetical protein HRU76_08440 [Phycisphaeraceae bacterium]|nr:MAG: hypothetical protein HRU76_08440 [Phycisphaeraceae bacterium]